MRVQLNTAPAASVARRLVQWLNTAPAAEVVHVAILVVIEQ